MGSRNTTADLLDDDPRASDRVPASKRVRYEIAGGAYGEGLCWNLSRGGACLNLGSTQPVAGDGAMVELAFEGASFALPARIVWVKEIGPLRRMGLVFHELTEEQRALVEDLLRKLTA